MIKYVESTVFNTDAQALVNAVNTVGYMGAGLALEFALRYPKMEEEYKKECNNRSITVGHVSYYSDGIKTIISFPTKADFRYPSQLKWIEEGLINFAETYKQYNIQSVAFPKLGCSNGGLQWKEVRPVMERILGCLSDLDVYICLDSLPYAEGIEKRMVETINSANLRLISKSIRLTDNQIRILECNRPITRFRTIQTLSGIGKKTYQSLFLYCYQNYNIQMTLFN